MWMTAQQIFWTFAIYAGVAPDPMRAKVLSNDTRRRSLDCTESPPPYSKEPDSYFSVTSPRDAKRIRRARYFLDGSLRRNYSSSSAIITNYYEDGCHYSPSLAASSHYSLPGGLSPLEKYFFPPLPTHRRTTSDSAAVMSVVSSTSAPCSLSSGYYSSTLSSYSGYSTTVGSGHRRARSHASCGQKSGSMVSRADGRPANALPGESFEQRWVTPFKFRRVSPPASQAVSPKTRAFTPSVAHSPQRRGHALLGGCESDGELGRGGKHRLGGLRELGKKIRRRVISRRRDAAEMDLYGAGSN